MLTVAVVVVEGSVPVVVVVMNAGVAAVLGCGVMRNAVDAVLLGESLRDVGAVVVLKRMVTEGADAVVVSFACAGAGLESACCRPLDTAAAVVW